MTRRAIASLISFAGLIALAPSTSLAQGFPNVAQTPGALLSGLNAPGQGRTAIIAYHNGVLFTVPEIPSSQPGADFQVRTWDISDPTDPTELAQWGITPMPVNAHGYFKSGDYLVAGPNWPPETPWSFRATGPPGTLTRTSFPGLDTGIGTRGNLFHPFLVGDTYWSYGEVSGDAWIQRGTQELARWDHLGLTGVVGHPFLIGDLLIFASDQSRTGVATYDVSDLSNPVLLDVLTTGGPGGYWPEIWGGDGKLLIVFPYQTGGNGFRVVDATDPTNLRFVTDKPLSGDESMYIQFQDEFAFMGSHKVDMRTLESVLDLDGANAVRPNDGGVGVNTSQFLLPLGNLLVTGGIGANEGMAIWAHQSSPDTRGPSVGYHRPLAGQASYPVTSPITVLIHETLETPTIVNGSTFIVRPLGGSPISGHLTFSFNDILTFTPDQPLAANTTFEVIFPDGGIKDAAGNGIEGYQFTFSTGSSVGGNSAPVMSSFQATPYPAAPGGQVTLTAAAADPEGDSVEYRFDFGDGSPRTAWTSGQQAVHTYGAVGHYQATVQARDSAGSVATSATTVTVVTAPTGPAATRSTPVACDDGGRRIYKVNPDNDTLSAWNADSRSLVFEQPTCDDPRSVATSAQGELWVACHGDDRVRVHGANGAFITDLATGYGSAPFGLAMAPDGSAAYVSLYGSGELRRFSTSTRTETGSLPLGRTPRALAVSGDGSRVLVTRFLSRENRAEVWDVNASAMTLTRTLRLLKFGGEDHRDTTASGRGVANYLAGIAIAPDGQSAWVASTKPNDERGLVFSDDLDSDNTVRNILTQVDLSSGDVIGSVDIDNSDSASALAFSPLGDYLFVTLQGDDDLLVLDALLLEEATGLGSFITRLAAGAAPQGICHDAATSQTWLANFMGRSVSVFESEALFRFGERTLVSTEYQAVGSESLDPEILLGKRIFYHAGDTRMSAEGYLSCATCHVDGGHDGRTWDFTGRGEGFRNTTELRGRSGMGHGNVHWTANFDEIQDFENDIRGAFGGTGFLDSADFAATGDPLGPPKAGLSPDLDALAAYVASLGRSRVPRSPHRASDGSLTAAGVAGRAIFQAQGCGSCHGGARFTDSTLGVATLHDVGTLRTTSGQRLGAALTGIDTPTLLGVWETGPFLHDGSAPALEDVFTVAGGVVIQAESGTPSGGAQLSDQFVFYNHDDTVHGGALVSFYDPGARLTFSGVDGGPGGVGALEFRYSSGYGDWSFEVSVNGGAPQVIQFPRTDNEPQWRHTAWETARLEDVALTAGETNTITFTAIDNFPNFSLDDVVVTNADDLARAQPHRRVRALSAGEQAELVAYLRQLDGTPDAGEDSLIFADGFESGDLAAWSSSIP
ncbi:MAG: Ig-like domain-containing protein [Acidobacteriota bacterium]